GKRLLAADLEAARPAGSLILRYRPQRLALRAYWPPGVLLLLKRYLPRNTGISLETPIASPLPARPVLQQRWYTIRHTRALRVRLGRHVASRGLCCLPGSTSRLRCHIPLLSCRTSAQDGARGRSKLQ
ncbi:hypothetical protein CYMTET_16614, partial [Cymbomonas tetramitiformis]